MWHYTFQNFRTRLKFKFFWYNKVLGILLHYPCPGERNLYLIKRPAAIKRKENPITAVVWHLGRQHARQLWGDSVINKEVLYGKFKTSSVRSFDIKTNGSHYNAPQFFLFGPKQQNITF